MGKLYRKSYGGLRLTKGEKEAINLAVDSARAAQQLYRAYKEKRSKTRLAKAHVIKKIRSSNLPESVKQREIAKLSGITAQTKVKSLFFKIRRTPREIRQASEANF